MVRHFVGNDCARQRNGRILPTARQHPDPGSLEARIIALEADVAALTQDRKWLMELLAGLAVELEELR